MVFLWGFVIKGGRWQRIRYSDWLRAGRSGDRIPVGGESFRIRQDRPWGPPSLLYSKFRVSVKVRVKLTLEQATKAQRWSRGIAGLFL